MAKKQQTQAAGKNNEIALARSLKTGSVAGAERRITPEIARWFVANNDENENAGESRDLVDYDAIDDSAAEILSRFQGYLDLRGVKQLSAAAAEALAEMQATGGEDYTVNYCRVLLTGAAEEQWIQCLIRSGKLPGERVLTKADAQTILSEDHYFDNDCHWLIEDEAAAVLSMFNGESLDLYHLKLISAPAVSLLCKSKAKELKLRITVPTEAVSVLLCKYSGDLSLGDVTHLSDSVAAILSKFKGRLAISGTMTLSDSPGHLALAQKLSRQRGPIRIGVRHLSGVAAQILATSSEEIDLYPAWREGLESFDDHPGHIALAKKLCGPALGTSDQSEPLVIGSSEVSNAAAAVFASYDGPLNFNLLQRLSDSPEHLQLLEKLVRQDGDLQLSLKNVSDKVASLLAQHSEDLRLEELVSIPATSGCLALAQKLTRQSFLKLPRLEQISDEAAAILSKHKEDLFLPRLLELRETAGHILLAKKLTARAAYGLFFNRLSELPHQIAEVLGKCRGDLNLAGLTRLSDAAASGLAEHKGGVLSLDGLTSLSDLAAASFSKHKGGLSLSGLTSLSDSAVASLSKHKEGLDLSGLTSLSDAAAASLSKHKGELDLSGLTSLSDAAAASLSKHKGGLDLSGLTILTPTAAKSLGDLKDPLALNGLSEVTGDIARHLSRLRSSQWPSGLALCGITDLSDDAAEALQQLSCALCLDGVVALSDYSAACLGNYAKNKDGEPWLLLNGLTTISDSGLLSLYKKDVVWISEKLEHRLKALRTADNTVKTLAANGFFRYAKEPSIDLLTVKYPGTGLGEYFDATMADGRQIGCRRAFGADVEELVEAGISWFSSNELSHLGIEPSLIVERRDGNRCEWEYEGKIYTIYDPTIVDSRYARAACGLVTILNQMLEHNGSEERAFGVNEGNAFGVAFLTEPLRKIIIKVADEENRPQPQKELEQILKKSITKNETPFVRSAG